MRSLGDQTVTIPALGLTLELADGGTIRTQLSAKFRRDAVERELDAAGFAPTAWWADADDGFALCLAIRRPAAPSPREAGEAL